MNKTEQIVLLCEKALLRVSEDEARKPQLPHTEHILKDRARALAYDISSLMRLTEAKTVISLL